MQERLILLDRHQLNMDRHYLNGQPPPPLEELPRRCTYVVRVPESRADLLSGSCLSTHKTPSTTDAAAPQKSAPNEIRVSILRPGESQVLQEFTLPLGHNAATATTVNATTALPHQATKEPETPSNTAYPPPLYYHPPAHLNNGEVLDDSAPAATYYLNLSSADGDLQNGHHHLAPPVAPHSNDFPPGYAPHDHTRPPPQSYSYYPYYPGHPPPPLPYHGYSYPARHHYLHPQAAEHAYPPEATPPPRLHHEADYTRPTESKQSKDATSASLPKKKKYKKNKNLPKRPLSAYNMFFRDERAQMLKELIEAKEKEAGDKKNDMDEDSGDDDDKSKECKLEFQQLAKRVAAQWKKLSVEKKQEYEAVAAEGRKKYFEKVKQLKQEEIEKEAQMDNDDEDSDAEGDGGENEDDHGDIDMSDMEEPEKEPSYKDDQEGAKNAAADDGKMKNDLM